MRINGLFFLLLVSIVIAYLEPKFHIDHYHIFGAIFDLLGGKSAITPKKPAKNSLFLLLLYNEIECR